MSKPTPESVRATLARWDKVTGEKDPQARKHQADKILRALWEGVRKARKSHQIDVVQMRWLLVAQDTNKVLNQAMACADVLYGEGEK